MTEADESNNKLPPGQLPEGEILAREPIWWHRFPGLSLWTLMAIRIAQMFCVQESTLMLQKGLLDYFPRGSSGYAILARCPDVPSIALAILALAGARVRWSRQSRVLSGKRVGFDDLIMREVAWAALLGTFALLPILWRHSWPRLEVDFFAREVLETDWSSGYALYSRLLWALERFASEVRLTLVAALGIVLAMLALRGRQLITITGACALIGLALLHGWVASCVFDLPFHITDLLDAVAASGSSPLNPRETMELALDAFSVVLLARLLAAVLTEGAQQEMGESGAGTT